MAEATLSTIRKGDVVLVAYPGSTDAERLQKACRPAVIVSNNERNARQEDVLLIPICTNASGKVTDPMSVTISIESDEGKAAGLRQDSIVNCTVIATIPKRWLVNKIGQFSNRTMRRVDECIRRSTGMGDDNLAGVPRKPLPRDDDTGVALELPEPPAEERE